MKVQLRKILARLLVLSIIITSLTDVSMPVQASTDRRIIDITTGNSNYFLQEDGTIYDLRYKRDAGFTNVKKIVSGLNTIYAVTNDGKLLVNGSSSVGLLGLGDAVTSTSGEIMTIPIDGVENFFLEDDSAYAVTSDGIVYSWGNKNKYLGHSGYSNITWVPTLVPNVSNVEKIVISKDATYAIQKDGIIKAWGANTKKTVSSSAYSVSSPVTFTLVSDVRDIVATTGSIAIYYLLNDGSVVSKTDGSYGHSNTSPIQGAKKIAAGFGHAIALMPNGDVYTIGRNNSGQVGVGNTTDTTTYTKLSLKGVVDVFAGQQCTFAVLEDGSIYAWGFNINAILGFDSGNTSVLSPTKLSDTTFIVSKPPVITVEPYNTALTNEDITVNVTTDKGTLNKSSHTFIENGSFDFIAIDESTGLTATETVTITNIDKIAPITPIITSEELNSNSIAVSITYPSDAIIKQYKIDDGVWQDYSNSLTITTNSVVYARGQDLAGNWSNEAILGVKPIQGILDEIEDMLDGVKGDTITDKIGNILGDLEKAKEDLDKITADNEALQEELDSLRAYIESLKDIVFGSASGQTDAALKTKLEEVFAQLDGLKADSELLNRVNTLLGTTNDTIEHRINELLDDESSLANIVDMLKLEGYLLPNSTTEELKNVIDDLIASDKALDSVLEVLGGSSTKGTVVQDVQDLINRVSELETFVDSLKSELGLPVDATLDDILATIDSLRSSLELPDGATFEEIIEAIEKLKASLVAEKEKSSSLQNLVDDLTQEIENIKGQLGLPGANNAELIQKIIEMQNEILDLKDQLDSVNSDLSDLLADKARLEKTILDAMDSLSEYEGATLQERIQDIKDTVSSLESDLAIANGKISDLESELDALKKENTTLKERIDELEGLLEAEELENQELQGMIDGLNADLREIANKLGIPDSDKASIIAEIGVLQQRIIELTSELEASNNVISGLKTQITDLSNEIQSAMDSLSEYERDTLLERIEAIKDRVSSLESQLANANSRITNLESEIDDLRRENGELKDKVEELEEKVTDLEEKLASEEETNKGLQDTITALNTALKEIAAKLSIPDSDKASIIAEIGVLQQRIIELTSELEASNNVISGLKTQITDLSNEIQSAMDSLSEYERDTLLERIEAIKDRVSSLESQLANANGKITNLESEIDELRRENGELKDKVEELEEEVADLEEKLASEEQINKGLQDTIIDLNNALKEIAAKLSIPDSDKASIIAEIGVLQQKIISLTSELEDSNNIIIGLKAQNTALSNEIQSAMDSLSEYERNTLLERIDAIKDRVSSLESQLAFANSEISDLVSELDALKKENTTLKERIEELEGLLEAKELENQDLQGTIDGLNADLREISSKLGIPDSDKASIIAEIGVLQQRIIELTSELEASNNVISGLKTQITDLSNEIQSAMDSLSDYERDTLLERIDAIKDRVSSLESLLANANSRITNLESEIDELRRENGELKDKVEELEDKVADLEEKLASEEQTNKGLQDTITALNNNLKEIAEKLGIDDVDKESILLAIGVLQQQIIDLVTDLEASNNIILDLNRQISDLSGEIQDAMNSLSEYDGVRLQGRINSILSKVAALNQENKDLISQITDLLDRIKDLEAENKSLSDQLDEANRTIDDLRDRLDAEIENSNNLQDTINELTKEIERLEDILDLTGKDLADQILNLQDQLEDLKEKLAEANSTISDLNLQIEDLSKVIDRLQKIINESLDSLSEYEGVELLERIEDIKNKKNKVESDLDDANQRNTDLNNQLSSVKDQLRDLQLLVEVLKGQLEDKDEEIARLLELLKQKNTEIINLGNQVDKLTEESEKKDQMIIDLQSEIDRLKKELEGLDNNHVCPTPEVPSKPSDLGEGDIIIKKDLVIDNIVRESVIDSDTGSVDANEGWELSTSLDNDTIWTDSLTPRSDTSFTGLYSFFDNNLNNVIGVLSVADSVDSKNGFMKYTFYARKVNDKSKVYVCSVDVEVTDYITPETLVKSSVLDDPRTYSIENSYVTEVNGSVKFDVKANYGNVGRKEVRYQVVPENMDFDPDGTWILVKGDSFIVEEQDENFRVYIKFIDKAGNYTVDKTVGFAVVNGISDLELESGVSSESNVGSTNSAPVFTVSKSIAENGTYLVQLRNLGKDDKVTYTSSNTKVATVTKNGEIVAKSKGVSRVTGTVISKNRTYKFVVNVTVTNSYPTTMNIKDVDLLSNSDATLTMYKVVEQGKSTTFKLSGIENGKVSYSSSDRTVATVSSSGVVTGKKKGFTTIHIRAVVDNIVYDYAVLVRVDDGTPNKNISKYLY